MFWNKEEKLKTKLLGLKKVKVEGMSFVIKRMNPLLDFAPDKIPQIFTDFVSRRPSDGKEISEDEVKRMNESIKPVLLAGIYKPHLAKVDKNNRFKESGLTVDDLFIDNEIAYTLFYKIVHHSLSYFRGLEGLFFSIKIKLWLSICWLRSIRSSL